MPLASVATRSELRHRQWPRWRVGAAGLLGALAIPAAAWAQLPASDVPAGDSSASQTVPAPALPPAALAVTPDPVPVIPVLSRLPDAISAQARAGMLELLAKDPATGQTVLVLRLPLVGAKFDTVRIGSYLYVARGDAEVLVIDVRDPLRPAVVTSFLAGGAVGSLWGGTGSLTIRLGGGAIVLFDVRDPLHPRYQSLVAPPAAAAPAIDEEIPQPRPREEDPPRRREEDQHRLAASIRPFLFFANRSPTPTSGGAILDFSYQYAKVGGLWWGIEVSPLVFSSYYDSALPAVNTRVWFGYSGRSFAVAAALGSGVTDDQSWIELGPVLRFGQLTHVHATLRLLWSVVEVHDYPSSGEFNLEGPISQRIGLRYNFTGDSALNGFHTTLGTQFFVGGDHRWRTTVLTPALGFAYMRSNAGFGSAPYVHHPGVIFSFTVEPRW